MGFRDSLLMLRRAKVRGTLKSAYYSLTRTDRLDTLLFSREVIVEIDRNADITANGGLEVGVGRSGVTHPRLGRSKVHFKDGSTVRFPSDNRSYFGPGSVVTVEGEFMMGDSHFNANGTVICGEKITIGEGGRFAWNVTVLDDDRHELVVDGIERPQSEPVVIGDNVWIGHDVTVTKGVTVGEGAVIGSNSVVTTDVPPHSLAMGHPAKVVHEDIKWE